VPVTFPASSGPNRPQWWLLAAARILLLGEGLGLWAILIVSARVYGSLILYYIAGITLVGTALLLGVPALIVALWPRLVFHGRRISVFVVLNSVGAIVIGVFAFSPPNPVWFYAVIAAAGIGATVLLFLAALRVRATVAAAAVAVAVVLVGYATTYALPPTLPPAPALHFKGVLIVPSSAIDTVTPEPRGSFQLDHVDENETAWMAAVVNPGTYGYAQACNGDWDHPTQSTVQVSWGAMVMARNLCPAPGTVTGFVTWTPCQPARPAPGLDCRLRPLVRQPISFKGAASVSAYATTTDTAGNYTILLPPDRYTVWNDFGYVLTSSPRDVTVESGGTSRLDLAFRFGS
jgi:hypothetical protein